MVASVAGTLTEGRINRARPFRVPHHSAPIDALVGGCLKVRLGDVPVADIKLRNNAEIDGEAL